MRRPHDLGFRDLILRIYEYRLQVSQHIRGGERIDEWILRFLGKPVSRPQPGEPPRSPANLSWHRREVFRQPARSFG